MRPIVAVFAGLAGFATLPALAAVGEVDGVTAWLRGLLGADPISGIERDGQGDGRTGGDAGDRQGVQGRQQPTAPSQDRMRAGTPEIGVLDLSAADPALATSGEEGGKPPAPAIPQAKARALPDARPQRVLSALPSAQQRQLPDDPSVEAEDPFASPTYRMGSWVIRPSVDASLGRTSNMEGKPNGEAGPLWRLRPEVTLSSNWSRHALDVTLRGTFNGYPTEPDLNTPAYDANAKLRLDLADEMTADLAVRMSAARGSAAAAENPAGTAIPSTTLMRGASLGFSRAVGIVGLTLRGDVDRTTYSGGQLSDGSPIETDSARNNTKAVLALRTSLDASPSVKPFVEVQQTVRRYDAATSSGRDSTGQAILAGASLRFGPLLSGELAVGWTREQLSDPNLPLLTGTLVDAALLWSPTPLSRVRLTAKTSFDPTTLAGSSGSVSHEAGVTLEQSLRRDLTATLGAKYQARTYAGLDRLERTATAEGELAWSFSPHLQIYGRGEWTRFTGPTAAEDYGSVTLLTGLRIR